ncbi:hypothetical protein [Exiguobacterium sp. OS-77]|uniref:spermine/spermidine synthase domain-containing protein n=1 Tax=Exiguobacterium sp. OS-77 TaxID=1241306 RepID=UPI0003FC2ABF|nr:hypothetical protein [Exiguobacterium sp. OS-77]
MIRRVTNEHTAYYGHLFHAQNILNAEENKGRSIEIYESSQFNRLMMLDRTLVTSERDAFAYYEMLVHVILYAHPNPKRVLFIGNARKLLYHQVLKHSDLQQVDHVVLDESIARHYDEWFKTDTIASHFIRRLESVACTDHYDIIVFDLPRNYSAASCNDMLRRFLPALRSDGLWNMILPHPMFESKRYEEINRLMRQKGNQFEDYLSYVPTFPGGIALFRIGTNTGIIQTRVTRGVAVETKYFDAMTHEAAFVLPRYIKETRSS